MEAKKIILVTGATGAQGGSVARALLSQDKFAVRIFTRDDTSPKAIALQLSGAELAIGDFENVESLRTAMKGVYGVFGLTDFEEHLE